MKSLPKPINNFVLVKSPRSRSEVIAEQVTLRSGITIDGSYNKGMHAISSGEVAMLPDELIYQGEGEHGNAALDFDTSMELQIGDKVIFHYKSVLNAFKDNAYVNYNDEFYFFIRYSAIYCTMRKETCIPVNGYVLVTPVKEEIKTTLDLPDSIKNKISETEGIVEYLGTPNRGYRFFPDEGDMVIEIEEKKIKESKLKKGDRVLFKRHNSVPMQYSIHSEVDDKTYFVLQRKDVILKKLPNQNIKLVEQKK